MNFLPVTAAELDGRPDFVMVTGDAYVDHPSFGVSIIARYLELYGYSVAILAQPDWRSAADFTRFGEPRLAFLVSGGNIDSMVNNYTVALNKRKTDAYSPGGVPGKRPNRATIVYSNRIREAYKNVPIILGGIEASLRRLAHYDYWDNAVRRSILLDSAADLLVYGMGERQIIEIAEALASGIEARHITFIDGTVFKTRDLSCTDSPVILPSFKQIKEPDKNSKAQYAKSVILQHKNTSYKTAQVLAEEYGGTFVVQNKPAGPLTTSELDRIYSMPFTRDYHPMYKEGIPAIEEVKFSIIANRGCLGACNFCALGYHQGRHVRARSAKSILAEAEQLTHDPQFKGYIHDVGGPTANFGRTHKELLKLLRSLRQIPNIKKVFIRSGIRYDYLLNDPDGGEFLQELCEHHISGRLKVAPEHISEKVLAKMNKPGFEIYRKFAAEFERINRKLGKKQYLVPYLMSGHPGCTLDDAIELAQYLKSTNQHPELVQDFYPTPATISSCMYYTGLNPRSMKKIYVAKSRKDKAMQRALMQYALPTNRELVRCALRRAGRGDFFAKGGRA